MQNTIDNIKQNQKNIQLKKAACQKDLSSERLSRHFSLFQMKVKQQLSFFATLHLSSVKQQALFTP